MFKLSSRNAIQNEILHDTVVDNLSYTLSPVLIIGAIPDKTLKLLQRHHQVVKVPQTTDYDDLQALIQTRRYQTIIAPNLLTGKTGQQQMLDLLCDNCHFLYAHKTDGYPQWITQLPVIGQIFPACETIIAPTGIEQDEPHFRQKVFTKNIDLHHKEAKPVWLALFFFICSFILDHSAADTVLLKMNGLLYGFDYRPIFPTGQLPHYSPTAPIDFLLSTLHSVMPCASLITGQTITATLIVVDR